MFLLLDLGISEEFSNLVFGLLCANVNHFKGVMCKLHGIKLESKESGQRECLGLVLKYRSGN